MIPIERNKQQFTENKAQMANKPMKGLSFHYYSWKCKFIPKDRPFYNHQIANFYELFKNWVMMWKNGPFLITSVKV